MRPPRASRCVAHRRRARRRCRCRRWCSATCERRPPRSRRRRRPRPRRPVRGSGGPQPEGAVHVHPRALRCAQSMQRAERVAGPAVDVAGLEAHDRRGVQVGQVRGNDAPLAIGGQPQRPARPSPIRPRALSTVACTSSPTTTWTGGAPTSPRAAASQPVLASTASRAAARQVALAIDAPETKLPEVSAGRPSSWLTQRWPPRQGGSRPGTWPTGRCSGPTRRGATRPRPRSAKPRR